MANKAAHLKDIADGTIDAVRKGMIDDPYNRSTYSLKHDIAAMLRETKYYDIWKHYLMNWQKRPRNMPDQDQYVRLEVQQITTLAGLRYMQSNPQEHGSTFGILNFASGTRPGGGFRNGASAQEESLARSSTLFRSLESDRVKAFYDDYKTRGDPFYSHAMIYSPKVVFFRDDNGGWLIPTKADVLTSAAVNAKLVRDSHGHASPEDVESWIRKNMHERMGRILEVFEYRGVKNLVLGSFGTGVYQNDVETVAKIWRELLYDRDARFKFSFHNVLFAIPDHKTLNTFKQALFDGEQSGSGRRSRSHGSSRC